MIIRLPFPAKELMPNRKNGSHWTTTKKVKDQQRLAGRICALASGEFKDKGGNIPLSLLYLTPDRRKRDLDNLLAASKAMLDGVAEALGVDDSRFRPIVIDAIHGPDEGCLIAAVGVEMVGYAKAGVK